MIEIEFKKEELIKSPLNYTGGKFKLLPQILPYFPDKINTFYDLFCGGCNVGVNVKANKIICNDIENHVISLLNTFLIKKDNEILKFIYDKIHYYNLSETSINGYEYYGSNSSDGVAKFNKKNYLKLRNDYNNNQDNDLLFFVTLCFAFSNQIRFNKNGKFNMPVNKRDFNKNIKNNLIAFVNRLKNINVKFTNKDFKECYYEFKIDSFNNDFVYCDPPYLVTCASYNENDGWNIDNEKELLEFLDCLNNKHIKFALSNVLESKGKSNDILKEWSEKYRVIHLNNTYSNCSYHTKDKSKNSTDEVLIINY